MAKRPQVKGYVDPTRKAWIESIVAKASGRLSESNIVDELAEIGLPILGPKYGVPSFPNPTQDTRSPRRTRRNAA